jgi:hypothetical protein
MTFISVSLGRFFTCAVPAPPAKGVRCWGEDGSNRQVSGWKAFKASVTGKPTPMFTSVSSGDYGSCAVTKGPKVAIKCWGYKAAELTKKAPKSAELMQTSCMTMHPDKSGPTACTSCDPKRSQKHFTIVDPRTNTGTCTASTCPACKPRKCCGPHHKHFVVNTVALTGVCVRHSDDCTPVCMPRGERERNKPRVCSKGCNQLLKVDKEFGGKAPPTTTNEKDLYDMVVCQADKRVICDPLRKQKHTKCRTDTTTKATARCPFDVAVWNLGPTCIASNVLKLKGTRCHGPTANANIMRLLAKSKCREATRKDHKQCSRLAMSY